MEHFTLTKDMLIKAKSNGTTYMPLNMKEELSRQIAISCVEDMETAEQNKEANKILAMPQLKKENSGLKTVLLANTLLGFYFDIDVMAEGKEKGLNEYDAYDYFAGGHLANQLERFKADAEVKDIAFDISSDFKEFKRFVDTEIFNEKSNNNDPIMRLNAAIGILSTPENIQELYAAMQKIGEETEKETEK